MSRNLVRKPISEATADELHRELVTDFVNDVHTPIMRFMAAIRRIAAERKLSQERVYQDIRQEALALGGTRSMFG